MTLAKIPERQLELLAGFDKVGMVLATLAAETAVEIEIDCVRCGIDNHEDNVGGEKGCKGANAKERGNARK